VKWLACVLVLAGTFVAHPCSAQSATESPSGASQLTPRTSVTALLDASYSLQSFAGVPITGAAFSGVLGVGGARWDAGAQLEVILGRSDGGLSARTIRLGGFGEARFGRFRVGGAIRAGGIVIDRVTTDGNMSWAMIGVSPRFSADLLTFDAHGEGALFVVVKPSIDATVIAPVYGVSAGIGARF
jgi:hypothetical protein